MYSVDQPHLSRTTTPLCVTQKRMDCLTELSLARSCVPAARDGVGLLDLDPPPGGGGVRDPPPGGGGGV